MILRLKFVVARSLFKVWRSDFRYGGFQFANRKLCGWRVSGWRRRASAVLVLAHDVLFWNGSKQMAYELGDQLATREKPVLTAWRPKVWFKYMTWIVRERSAE